MDSLGFIPVYNSEESRRIRRENNMHAIVLLVVVFVAGMLFRGWLDGADMSSGDRGDECVCVDGGVE